jgi:hypothetical protein
MSEDTTLDLSSVSDKIDNIEVLNLGSGEQNITSLHVADVLSITDTDFLRIDGDTNDSITLDTSTDEWTLGGFKTDAETGQKYREVVGTVTDDTVTLEISTDIDIIEH